MDYAALARFCLIPPDPARHDRAFCLAWGDLFCNARGWDVPLWGSCLDEGRLLGAHTLGVQDRYAAWGLQVRHSLNEIADHIGIEAAFCAFLLAQDGDKAQRALQDFSDTEVFPLLKSIIAYAAGIEDLEDSHREVISFLTTITGCRGAAEGDTFLSSPSFPLEPCTLPLKPPSLIHTAGRTDCGGRCSFSAVVTRGTVRKITFDAAKTPCAKYCVRGAHYLSTFLTHRRLRYPLKRVGERGEGRFERISWDEALDTLTGEWQRITAAYGPESRYFPYATGVNGIASPKAFARRLAALDGGYLDYHNSYSTAATRVATQSVYGNANSGSSSLFLAKSRFILLWAHNPRETLFGAYLMDALAAARKSGTPIAIVDPRYSDTARVLDADWYPIRPGTDSALADAMAYVIITEGLEDRAFMDTYCHGFDRYEEYLLGKFDGTAKTPDWAAAITGLPPLRIAHLARSYATAKPAALLAGWGAQRTGNGEQSARSTCMLCCLTGNVGVEGGNAGGAGIIPGYPAPVIPAIPNPYGGSIPTYLWTDAVLRGTEMTAKDDGVRGVERLKAPIKLILNMGGNALINQHGDINRTARILRDTSLCEFIVVSDVFMTSSARFADLLLPAPSFLECANMVGPFNEGDYLLHNNPLMPPLWECRFEYDWLSSLARRLGHHDAFCAGNGTVNETLGDWLRSSYETLRTTQPELPPYDEFRSAGGHFYSDPTRYAAFREQVTDPARHPFPTPSGKIEIYSETLAALDRPDIPPIPCYTPGFENSSDPRRSTYPFQLIAWQSKRYCHSIHGNNPALDRIETPRVAVNPADAAALGITDGTQVELWNDRGRLRIRARVTTDVMPGVLAIPAGVWYTPDKDGVDTKGNVNTLTTLRPSPLSKGNPQHSILVNVCPL